MGWGYTCTKPVCIKTYDVQHNLLMQYNLTHIKYQWGAIEVETS